MIYINDIKFRENIEYFFLLSNYGNRMGKVFYRGNICSLR